MLRRHFIAGTASGAALAALPLHSHAQTKPGRWMRLESPRFILYATGDEAKAKAEIVALERYHVLLSKLLPRENHSEMKLSVFAAAHVFDLKRSWPNVHESVAGFYDSSVEQVKAVTAPFRAYERQGTLPKNIRAMDARVVLFHEYAHHFMRANLRVAYPRWYGEGLAEFASTADLSKDGIQIGKFTNLRSMWLSRGEWLPIGKFIAPDDLSSEETAMFYAQSWLAAHYLFTNSERAKGLDRYVLAIANGADAFAAFEPAFGITPAQFDKELRDYKGRGISIYKAAEEPEDHASRVKIERLSAAADELLLAMSYLRAVPLAADAAEEVAFVRSEAAKFPDDPLALQSLATVDLWYGEPEKARASLDVLRAAHPKDAEVLHLSGLCDLRQAYRASDPELFKRARAQFADAHRQDATRAHSLFRYVECVSNLESSFTQHMLDVSLEAYRLAPQIVVIKLLAAQGLMQHKRWKEAQMVLLSMMMDAHGSDRGGRVLSLMQAAKEEKNLPLTFYGAAHTMELQAE